jgi:hypothetical protein
MGKESVGTKDEWMKEDGQFQAPLVPVKYLLSRPGVRK